MNCLRCNTPWGEHHNTMFTSNKGVFPLCQKCWSKLSPEERLPYYERLVRRWMKEIPVISKAVLEGK